MGRMGAFFGGKPDVPKGATLERTLQPRPPARGPGVLKFSRVGRPKTPGGILARAPQSASGPGGSKPPLGVLGSLRPQKTPPKKTLQVKRGKKIPFKKVGRRTLFGTGGILRGDSPRGKKGVELFPWGKKPFPPLVGRPCKKGFFGAPGIVVGVGRAGSAKKFWGACKTFPVMGLLRGLCTRDR